jgi:hypothetical protein
MVRAILRDENPKTQTRRALRKQPPPGYTRHCWFDAPTYGFTDEPEPAADWWTIRCPYGVPGDRLYTKETWALVLGDEDGIDDWTGRIPDSHPGLGWQVWYRSGHPWANDHPDDRGFRWRPSIFMPRWASRITLEVTEVRVERLQAITEEDAVAEGMHAFDLGEHGVVYGYDPKGTPGTMVGGTAIEALALLWDSINGAGSWDRDEWVWAVSFRRVEPV